MSALTVSGKAAAPTKAGVEQLAGTASATEWQPEARNGATGSLAPFNLKLAFKFELQYQLMPRHWWPH